MQNSNVSENVVETRLMWVSLSDRAGEPAGRSGPGPAGLPHPLRRDPHAALQPDRRTVSASAPSRPSLLDAGGIYSSRHLKVSPSSVPHCRVRETSAKPRKEFVPKPRPSLDFSLSENHNGGIHGARSPGENHTLKPADTEWNWTRSWFVQFGFHFLCPPHVSVSIFDWIWNDAFPEFINHHMNIL